MSFDTLPADFPQHIPKPRFYIGDYVQWKPLPVQDFGIVTGIQYAPAIHLEAWAWQYTIWLDGDSPSHAWILSDIAWELDLEPIPVLPHQESQHEQKSGS